MNEYMNEMENYFMQKGQIEENNENKKHSEYLIFTPVTVVRNNFLVSIAK